MRQRIIAYPEIDEYTKTSMISDNTFQNITHFQWLHFQHIRLKLFSFALKVIKIQDKKYV